MPDTPVSGDDVDALKLLQAQHEDVKTMFERYDSLVEDEAPADERQQLAKNICAALTIHAQIEEEVFYPAAREALDEEDLLDEALVEHDSAKRLIAEIEAMKADDPMFDAKVKVLGEYIDHHVQEEEHEMFPKARKSEMDLQALGEQMKQRTMALVEEMGIVPA